MCEDVSGAEDRGAVALSNWVCWVPGTTKVYLHEHEVEPMPGVRCWTLEAIFSENGH